MGEVDQAALYRNAAGARSYDALVSAEDCERNVARMLSQLLPKNARVLELGAGTGRLTQILLEVGCTVTATEQTPEMASVARERLERAGLHGWTLELLDASTEQLPRSPGGFDAVIAGWVLGHWVGWHPHRWRGLVDRCLTEMERAAEPSGRVIVIETLGTGFEQPTPPPSLLPYYALLEERGYVRRWERTDYLFPSHDEAVRTLTSFFGNSRGVELARAGSARIPECTGFWCRPSR